MVFKPTSFKYLLLLNSTIQVPVFGCLKENSFQVQKMALFNFGVDEWAFFVFILGSLAIYTGAVGSYSTHMATWSLAQIVEWPLNNIVLPVFGGPFPLLALPLFILFVVYLTRTANFVDPGILGAVFVGVVALALAA